MRLTPIHQSVTRYPWLHGLKTTQLQHIAQKTGIPSSGPKATLINNLENGLVQCQYQSRPLIPPPPSSPGPGTGTESEKKNQKLSILSIDMGIRNLAFAHLLVDLTHLSNRSGSGCPTRSTLTAWRRLALPETATPPEEFKRLLDLGPTSSSSSHRVADGKKGEKEKGMMSFSPPLYAQHAYGFVTALVERYKPTHVLIERQRFRSGGGSAVQEWTIRVGVFEGMIYAVLCALRHTNASSSSSSTSSSTVCDAGMSGFAPVVLGIEPQRVAKYWAMDGKITHASVDGGDGKKKKKKKKVSSREGKKAKIDLVGSWLNADADADPDDDGLVAPVGVKDDDPILRQWVDGYLWKWKGGRRRCSHEGSGGKGGSESNRGKEIEMGKLDDLADCLLQGVTWLEWQAMRERVVRYGPGTVDV